MKVISAAHQLLSPINQGLTKPVFHSFKGNLCEVKVQKTFKKFMSYLIQLLRTRGFLKFKCEHTA